MLGWIDTLLQGILLGGLYSLYATGLSVIFGIMRLVNLAHGDLIVLGAFLILAATSAGVPLPVACAVVVPLMFALGYVLQSVLLNRALGRNILPPLLITFGLSIIVQNGLLETFSADTRRLDVGSLLSSRRLAGISTQREERRPPVSPHSPKALPKRFTGSRREQRLPKNH